MRTSTWLFLGAMSALGCGTSSNDATANTDPSAAGAGGAAGASAASGSGRAFAMSGGAGTGGAGTGGASTAGTGGMSSTGTGGTSTAGSGGATAGGGVGATGGAGGSAGASGGASAGKGGGGAAGKGGGASAGAGGAAVAGAGGGVTCNGGGGGTAGAGGAGGASCPVVVPGNPCAVFPQCGCPSGQNCVVKDFTAGTTACVNPGGAELYGLCSNENDCPVGAACAGGTCRPTCATDCDCVSSGSACFAVGNPPTPGLHACGKGCDLLDASSCGLGQACIWRNHPSGTGQVTECANAGTGVGPDGCPGGSAFGTCAAGYQCVNYKDGPFDDTTCAKQCAFGDDTPCNGGTCLHYAVPVIIGGVEYGHCGVPCDLAHPDVACGTGNTCIAFPTQTSTHKTDCLYTAATGTGPGDCASSFYGCAPGYYCDSTGNCLEWCVLGDSSNCPGGTSCKQFNSGPYPANGKVYGACFLGSRRVARQVVR